MATPTISRPTDIHPRPITYAGRVIAIEFVDSAGHPVAADEAFWLDHFSRSLVTA